MKKYIRLGDQVNQVISETRYNSSIETKLEFLGPLGYINIFVGANNSGKSRFMRGLIKTDVFILNNSLKINELQKKYEEAKTEYLSLLGNRMNIEFGINKQNTFSNEFIINDAHLELIRFLENTSGLNHVTARLDNRYFGQLTKEIDDLFLDITKRKTAQSKIRQSFLEVDLISSIVGKNNPNGVKVRIARREGYINTKIHDTRYPERIIFLIKEIGSILKEISETSFEAIIPPQRIYLPVLRTASTMFENLDLNYDGFKKIKLNLLRSTIIHNYKFSGEEIRKLKIKIVTGLDLYSDIRKTRNSVRKVRKSFEGFEKFLSKNFFNGSEVDIVAREGDKESEENIILFIGGHDRDIHELGDGIQALIILMYSIYTSEDRAWVFIEEPEINLHPGLQRVFIEQLKSDFLKKKKLKLFFTTHSNHLLDLSMELDEDISIFNFEEKRFEEKSIHLVKNVLNSDINILNSLGVRNSSVFLSNCSIWIEGVTDRIIIKAFLRVYNNQFRDKKKYNEDIHYSFLEYAGSNLTHYLFDKEKEIPEKIKAQFISNRIFLIADKDKGKEKKHAEMLSQENKGFRYHVLKVREIENIISSDHLKLILPELFSKLKTDDNLDNLSLNQGQYGRAYLGEYLKNKIDKKYLPRNFTSASGTLATPYKNKFAKLFSETITWDLMSETGKQLTHEIYSFLAQSNK